MDDLKSIGAQFGATGEMTSSEPLRTKALELGHASE
jgi:hypothetical protein